MPQDDPQHERPLRTQRDADEPSDSDTSESDDTSADLRRQADPDAADGYRPL